MPSLQNGHYQEMGAQVLRPYIESFAAGDRSYLTLLAAHLVAKRCARLRASLISRALPILYSLRTVTPHCPWWFVTKCEKSTVPRAHDSGRVAA